MLNKMAGVIAAVLYLSPAGVACAQLITMDDTFGIPVNGPLLVEAPGVLDNDTLDDEAAEDGGVTAELVSNVSSGTLVCETDAALEICADGSFTYTPGAGFSGNDTFTYRAVAGSVTSTATVKLSACTGGPQVFACWKEQAYVTMLTELGFVTFREGFENDRVWADSRSTISFPASTPFVISKGIRWTSNHPATNNITTGSGPARTGQWGVFDRDHGSAAGSEVQCDIDNPPEHCLFFDGVSGTRLAGKSLLHGVGGYFTGIHGANLVFIIDGANQVGGIRLGTGPHLFFGVIDTAGFTHFEAREIDGKIGQALYIWADDFTFGTLQPVAMPWIPLLLLD